MWGSFVKRFLFLFLPFLFLSCASVSVSRDKLRDGNYIDNSFTHSIAVVRTYPLQEFGITPEEWKTHFDNSLLYRASGSGNAFMSKEEVKGFTFDAVRITTKNRHRKYSAIVEGKNGTTLYADKYSLTEKYDFSCYAIMFDNEDLIPVLRETFGRLQILEAQ